MVNSIRLLRIYLFLLASLCSFAAYSARDVPFWISIRSNGVIDRQVAEVIGSKAGVIILRAAKTAEVSKYDYKNVVETLRANAPGVPVLAYAWATRQAQNGRIETEINKGLKSSTALALLEEHGQGEMRFLDITSEVVRRDIVKTLIQADADLAVDGLAIDLATRTPIKRPGPLAKKCRSQVDLCEKYASSMDSMFREIKRDLGSGNQLVFNGLFNFHDGQLFDQIRLLDSADMAAVEYFGFDPNESSHSFKKDVLPYLNVVSSLPRSKAVLVFGRGAWSYSDYVDDYLWQRYLYSGYLLAGRGNDLFKYHSSFQVPAHKGRSGGIDIYADWNSKLGHAKGNYYQLDGLYIREFTRGVVIVAPDDGNGGVFKVPERLFTLEGQAVSGRISLARGSGLILLQHQDRGDDKPVQYNLSASKVGSWGWSYADYISDSSKGYMSLKSLPSSLTGEHDLLLDYERSLTPYRTLELDVRFKNPEARAFVIAEVDDPRQNHMWAVVEVNPSPVTTTPEDMIEAMEFRSLPKKVNQPRWPLLQYNLSEPSSGDIVLHGPQIFKDSGLRFRRWSHLRLIGTLDFYSLTLSRPLNLVANP